MSALGEPRIALARAFWLTNLALHIINLESIPVNSRIYTSVLSPRSTLTR